MSKNRSGSECLLKKVESIMIGKVKLPGNILSDKTYQWNNNVQVVENKLAIKVSET